MSRRQPLDEPRAAKASNGRLSVPAGQDDAVRDKRNRRGLFITLPIRMAILSAM
jgi:hypothetical protein